MLQGLKSSLRQSINHDKRSSKSIFLCVHFTWFFVYEYRQQLSFRAVKQEADIVERR